jgi:hypothetical protein
LLLAAGPAPYGADSWPWFGFATAGADVCAVASPPLAPKMAALAIKIFRMKTLLDYRFSGVCMGRCSR